MKIFLVQKLLSVALVCAALYCVLAMFTQAMLGGGTPEEVTRDRMYAWGFFLIAGWLAMAAIHLWRRATAGPNQKSANRLFLFPLGHLLLTGGLYFFDFFQATPGSLQYLMIAVVLAAVGMTTFLFAVKAR